MNPLVAFFVVVALVYIAVLIWANYAANYALRVNSALDTEQAISAARSCFMDKVNRFEGHGGNLTVTPKLKRDAPSLVIEAADSGGGGSQLSMHGKYFSEKRGYLPWIPMHGTWIWRKQRKIAKLVASPDESTQPAASNAG